MILQNLQQIKDYFRLNPAIKNFKPEDFTCKCGCGEAKASTDLIVKLQKARTTAGFPFVVNSAYRCEAHNKKVGGATSSRHLTGEAVDIGCTDSVKRMKLVAIGIEHFTGIGVHKSFVHFDVRTDTPVLFLY